jgi:hypothetical protein
MALPSILVGVLAAVAGFVVLLVTTPAPHLRHDSTVDAIFDSRWLVAGARLLIGVAMAYLLASIGVRVWRRQWVRSAGSIDTDASTVRLADDRAALRRQLAESQKTIDVLRQRLQETLDAGQAAVATMETSPVEAGGTAEEAGSDDDG